MAARGIEHRSKEGVIAAYKLLKKPQFAIFAGSEIVYPFEGADMEEGEEQLAQALDMLEEGRSTATFTLRIYPDNTKVITNKTPSSASTTFMLNASTPTRMNEAGVMVIDNTRNAVKDNPGMGVGYTEMINRVRNLEIELEKEREARHQAQLDNLRIEMDNKIAGLTAASAPAPAPGWADRLIGLFEQLVPKPEIVGGWKDTFFGKRQNFIMQPGTPISGTSQQATQEETDMKTEWNPDNKDYEILMYNFLTPEEQKLKKSKQNALIQPRLATLTPEQLDEIQVECLEKIEAKITNPVLTLTLLNFQALDDEDTNKLLNHML